jgi:Mg2+ and Co2+ transporter CorA
MINTWQTNLTQNYMRVLDDKTFEIDAPSRRAMFPYERMLLQSSLENLALAREEYNDLTRRCGPLSDQTKQSLEIYEEDHGKAITAFTVVTVIFLPLSFVTSYFGMNTVDIRDMASGQSLFWAVALLQWRRTSRHYR